MKKEIVVLGAGSWGTALATVLANNFEKVLLYSRNKETVELINNQHRSPKYSDDITLQENIIATNSYEYFRDPIEDMVVALPVIALEESLRNISSLGLNIKNIVVSSKGIDNKLRFPSQICRLYFPRANIFALSGPNFAIEVVEKKFSKSTIGFDSAENINLIKGFFSTNYFKLETSDDLIGVELCGAIKNVIAIGIGIAKGLGKGENFISAFIVSAIREVMSLLKQLNAKPETIYSLAGLGDLLLTCYSRKSRNTTFGYDLVLKLQENTSQTVEGYYTAHSIYQLAQREKIYLPICQYIYEVIYQNAPIDQLEKLTI